MAENALAASELLDKTDPTLLTYKEIKRSYGSPLNFFLSFGLKPWNPEDCEEARAISRQLKADAVEEAEEIAAAEQEAEQEKRDNDDGNEK
jgi:hypothetical protein